MRIRIWIAALAAAVLTAGTSSAADLRVDPVYRSAPSFAPPFTWTGLYFGLNAGYSGGRHASFSTFAGALPSPNTGRTRNDALDFSAVTIAGSSSPSGGLVGGQLGFNWQLGYVVFGFEIDGQWAGQNNAYVPLCSAICSVTETAKLRSFATARGRVGYAWDNWLLYLTFGGAWVSATGDLTMTLPGGVSPALPNGATASFLTLSSTKAGVTVGLGGEWAFWEHWSAKLEYLYIDVDNLTATTAIPGVLGAGTITETTHVRDHVLRLGVNYRFGP